MVHDPDERAALLERAQNLPVVPLSLRAQYDLEMLAVGAFSPLDRFMAHDEYESVLYEMHLEDGALFPIPLAVPCREEVVRGHPREIALSDEQGAILALLEVDEVYPRTSCARCARCWAAGTARTRSSSKPKAGRVTTSPAVRACSTSRATGCMAPSA